MRVLLVRADGIGDALACVPLLAALRAAGHELGVVLQRENADVYAPGVARVHVVDRIPWPAHGYRRESYANALAAIRAAAYDLALVASEEPELYRLPRRAGIPRCVGFTHGWEKPLKSLWARTVCGSVVFRTVRAEAEHRHEAEVMYALGRGLVDEPIPRDVARLAPIVLEAPVPRGEAIAVQANPKWSAMGLADAVERVATAFAPGAVEVLDPASGLPTRAWIERIARAALLVTPDTGAAHVAGMVGTPCVDVFAADAYATGARRWRPWAAPAAVLAASGPATLDAIVSAARALLGAEVAHHG